MNNMMLCTMREREREFRDSGSIANTGYVSRFKPLLYVPAFSQKDFHYNVHTELPTQGPPLRIWVIQTGSTQLLSQSIQSLHKRQGITQITSTLRGIGT